MTDALAMFRAAALNPQTVKALCDAYEKPRKSLHDTGQPPIVREVIAERLIRLAEQGARDADRLCEKALAALGNKAVFEK